MQRPGIERGVGLEKCVGALGSSDSRVLSAMLGEWISSAVQGKRKSGSRSEEEDGGVCAEAELDP